LTWFLVDDGFHSHPKTGAASLAAIGLWAVAGSWCGDHLTDGHISHVQVGLLSRGAVELADELVTCGLWKRTRSGYRFHQWDGNGDGLRRNFTRKEVEERRRKKAEAGRKGGLASGKARSSRLARASPSVEPHTNPPPSSKEGRGRARADAGRSAPPAAPTSPVCPTCGNRTDSAYHRNNCREAS
jgi:hypothetical protein